MKSIVEKMKPKTTNSEDTSDDVNVLRNRLRLATEAEENANEAMNELASVVKEVVAEANQGKEKLTLAEERVRNLEEEVMKLKTLIDSKEEEHKEALLEANKREITILTTLDEANKENETLNNTIDRLRVEAEESILAWSGKEIEFVKLIKAEEDEKASVLEEKHKLFGTLTELRQENDKLREEKKRLIDVLNEANVAKEAIEEAKVEKLHLKASLAEERKMVILTQQTQRLKVNEGATHENKKWIKRPFPSSKKKLKSPHKEEESKKMVSSSYSSKHEHQSHRVEEEQKKSVNELESNKVEEEQKNWVNELKSNEAKEDKYKSINEMESNKVEEEPMNPFPSPSKDEPKSNEVEEKEKTVHPFKKEAKSSHGEQFKSLIPSIMRNKKDSSLEKDLKVHGHRHGHTRSYGAFSFSPKVKMPPLPGLTSKSKEVGDSRDEDGDDDNIRDMIFDVLDSPSTVSSSNDDMPQALEEFENEERPHFDDMEVERVGSHTTRKRVLKKVGGLLWKKGNHPHSDQNQNHQTQEHQNLHQEVTT